jgi:hypothetical protein
MEWDLFLFLRGVFLLCDGYASAPVSGHGLDCGLLLFFNGVPLVIPVWLVLPVHFGSLFLRSRFQ